MSLRSSRAQLAVLTRELLRHWEQTRHQWRDDQAREFESRYLGPLATLLGSTLNSIEDLDKLLSKIRRDCE